MRKEWKLKKAQALELLERKKLDDRMCEEINAEFNWLNKKGCSDVYMAVTLGAIKSKMEKTGRMKPLIAGIQKDGLPHLPAGKNKLPRREA